MADVRDMEKKLEEAMAKIEALTKMLETKAATPAVRYFDSKGKPQKFYTIKPRYVNGVYVNASPGDPAVVIFKASQKIRVMEDGVTPEDLTLRPFTEDPPVEKQEKPFAEIRRGPKDLKAHDRDLADGRPSDNDPAGR